MNLKAIKRYIPIFEWLPSYSSQDVKGDLSAGLTVGVMLIPQGMAYALIAGLPAIYGLYASTIPLFIYAILGTSRQLAVGPVALMSLLTATGIGAIATGDATTYVMLAATLAFMVGLIQTFMGLARLGFLINFISHPVISGFTSAAAVIIGVSQLKHLFGLDIPRSSFVPTTLGNIINSWAMVNYSAVTIGLIGIVIILYLRKVNRAIPGALVVVVLGILTVKICNLEQSGVDIVGTVPQGLPNLTAIDTSLTTWQSLFPIALTISLIGLMESIAVAKALQARHRNYEIKSNQEFLALGGSNIATAFFQGFPVAGGFARSAVNDQTGARTPFAAIISAVIVMMTLMFLTPLFYYLPKAVLASIILVAVSGLFDYHEAVTLWRTHRKDFWMLIATFLATLLFSIEYGILIGVFLSIGVVVWESSRPHVAILGKVPNLPFYRNISRFEVINEREDILIFRFDARLYFANVPYFKDLVTKQKERKGDKLKAIIINSEAMTALDSTGVEALNDLIDECKSSHTRLFFTGVRGPVRDVMDRSGLIGKIGSHSFFMNVHDAVQWYDDSKDHSEYPGYAYTLQSNKRS